MNTGVQISVRGPAFNSFGCISRHGIAGSCVNSTFHFWGDATLFSTAAALLYIPTSSSSGFQLLHMLVNTCSFFLSSSSFSNSHSNVHVKWFQNFWQTAMTMLVHIPWYTCARVFLVLQLIIELLDSKIYVCVLFSNVAGLIYSSSRIDDCYHFTTLLWNLPFLPVWWVWSDISMWFYFAFSWVITILSILPWVSWSYLFPLM